MARRTSQAHSTQGLDPSIVALQAPQRIFELKKERDERAKDIIRQAEEELTSVRKKAMAYKEEQNRQSALKKAERLGRLVDLVERRRQIEGQMLAIVTDLHAKMLEVEDMMLVGYNARQKEARQALEALSGKSQPA
ncbi:hypothetical protein AAL_00620 [Moelleriella libera RCEF 2490]|uniref:T-complex protein 1 n=1 Tax=Moelleriella libera RCEF 2490 TaxID=1081109 RepID=A0A166RPM1_9HYPO|nr:hypothetical protein AAL_00620 [Moelleriella libera RCEF 2490]